MEEQWEDIQQKTMNAEDFEELVIEEPDQEKDLGQDDIGGKSPLSIGDMSATSDGDAASDLDDLATLHHQLRSHEVSWPNLTPVGTEDHLSRAFGIRMFWFFEARDRLNTLVPEIADQEFQPMELVSEYPEDWPQWRIDSFNTREAARLARRRKSFGEPQDPMSTPCIVKEGRKTGACAGATCSPRGVPRNSGTGQKEKVLSGGGGGAALRSAGVEGSCRMTSCKSRVSVRVARAAGAGGG